MGPPSIARPAEFLQRALVDAEWILQRLFPMVAISVPAIRRANSDTRRVDMTTTTDTTQDVENTTSAQTSAGTVEEFAGRFLGDRVRFEVAAADEFGTDGVDDGAFDLVRIFDALHDMGGREPEL
jgi:hypothetical protein